MILRLFLLFALAPVIAVADEDVKAVQQELRERKLYFGSVDGRPSAGLRNALREFQESRGFDATGAVTPETMAALGVAPRLDAEEQRRRSVYAFLQRYLEYRTKGNLDAEMGCYAATVEYFDDGEVEARFLRQIRDRERDRWPQRKLVLLNRIASPMDAKLDRWLVTYRYRLVAQRETEETRAVMGDETLVAEREGSGWRIVAIRATEAL